MSRTMAIVIAIALVVVVIGVVAIVFAAGAIFTFTLGGERGSGNIVNETREASDFDRVSVCCGMQLLLKQGETEKLEIEGDDNIVSEIETRVGGDRLVVEYRSNALNNYRPSQPVRVYVVMPVVSGVDLSGGSRLDAATLETDRFELSTSGGSSADVESLTTQSLEVSVSGGGNTGVGSGVAGEQSVKLSGGGSYTAADLESQTAELDLSGGSRATVWVVETLDIQAGGGSSVAYYGNPRITQSTSGGSRIESMGSR